MNPASTTPSNIERQTLRTHSGLAAAGGGPGAAGEAAGRLRRYPVGAEVQPGGGVHLRVWAPDSPSVAVELAGSSGSPKVLGLDAEPDGYHSGFIAEMRAGSRYALRLASGSYADPASRFQPEGPHGPSEVVDGSSFPWTDQGWKGRPVSERVVYELHLGTFTPEGTWRAAAEQLPELARIGITVIEVMPLADFPGTFGWGYDGVSLFAPSRLYGSPDDVRAFIDRAHGLGLMAILDVVYNHVGPDGNHLSRFAASYFNRANPTEWGESLNFDGPGSAGVREFFVTNARYWIEEFHFDGLRLDATQQIFDRSTPHILAEIAAVAHAAGRGREIYLVAENEPQLAKLVRPLAQGGFGLDALWNDDFHHSAMVAATGKAEAYYSDHRGTPQEFISALKHGFLFQGEWYRWQTKRRGTPAFDLPPHRFVIFLQNHDQLANSLRGRRLQEVTSVGQLKALTALLLLAPQVPLLFQGQEFAASAPFLYFADHNPDLRRLVSEGRRKFLEQFPSIARRECRDLLAEPGDRSSFARCKLDFSDRAAHAAIYRLHIDLLRLRRETAVIHAPVRVDGAVLGANAFLIRYFSGSADDRLLLVNLGSDLHLGAIPEPLLAPPEDHGWEIRWTSEDPAYDGCGTPPVETKGGWTLPARSAIWLAPGSAQGLPAAIDHAHH